MSEKAKKVKVPEDTPLIRQFFEVKAQQPDAMLLYRVGDFYETYGADAVEASKVLGLVLTGKSNGDKGRIEMAGFPGLWLQLTPGDGTDLSKQDVGQLKADIQALGIDAIACYNMGGFTPDYAQQCANSVAIREQVDSLYDIPIFPTVSIGWDDSPRFPRKGADDITHINHSPEVFEHGNTVDIMFIQRNLDIRRFRLEERPPGDHSIFAVVQHNVLMAVQRLRKCAESTACICIYGGWRETDPMHRVQFG